MPAVFTGAHHGTKTNQGWQEEQEEQEEGPDERTLSAISQDD